MALRVSSQFKTHLVIDGQTVNISIKRFSPSESLWFNGKFARLGAAATRSNKSEPGEDQPREEEFPEFVEEAFAKFLTIEPGQVFVDDNEIVTGKDFAHYFGSRDDVVAEVLMNIFFENKLNAEQKRNWKTRLAPFVPTPVDVADRMMELAGVTGEDVVVDLGCGSGRLCVAAAKRRARAIGYDNDTERIDEARKYAEAEGVTDLCTFHHKDALEADLAEASVVSIYLLAGANAKLRPIFTKQLPKGARVVSHAFSMGGTWTPKATAFVEPPEGEELAHAGARWIYLYDVDKFRENA